ncbi:MAG: chromosomal replication initiator protein DnaA, partial [Deltaproteobacteria bacterium]|nr:chromosomal replication initiator protein DnaA [Deltaproteobacteria bacterium]
MNESIWSAVKEKIRSKVGEINYIKWFVYTRLIKEEETCVTIAVPDKFFQDWIEEYYLEMVEEELTALRNTPTKIVLQIDASLAAEMDDKISEEPVSPVLPQTSVSDAKISLSGLNPKYTFDRFVVGSANQFAHAAAKAVSDLPAGHYNPLFIYGGVGLGKTHLISAIGIEILKNFPSSRVLYVTAESFMNEVIFGIRYDKMVDLRKKYRANCDVLLMDDIQFLGGKERTQEEFFHTFNTLLELQKQIVVTSDRYPKDIIDMDDRIRSRLEWGLIADIQPPDLETRIAILKKKAETSRITLHDDVAIYLATTIRSNIRELEGALIRLSAYSSLSSSAITVQFAEQILSHIINKNTSICSIDSIQKMVSDHFKLKISDLKSTRRLKSFVVPRQIAMYLCKKHAGSSFPEIGEKFGGKDHTTVIHAVRKIEACITTTP